jgi:predicted aspartyl protease
MNPSIASTLKTAQTAYQDGKFSEAQAAYSSVAQLDPKNVTALEYLGALALGNNHPDEAVGHLKQALTHAAGLQRVWPFSAQVKARLGMAYYRADRFAEAARFFTEAAGPVALGPFKQLAALGKWLADFTEQPYIIEGPDETRVDFVITDPLPVVKISIGKGKPEYFLIDTGGSELVLDPQLAKESGVKMAATMVGEFAGAKKSALGLGRADSIQLGDFTIRNVPVHTLDLTALSPLFGGLDIKGILGTRLLMHFLSTIDYRAGALILRRTTPENLTKVKAQQAKQIPFWLVESHYIVAWGTVNGLQPMLFCVDTGLAGSAFIPSDALVQAAGIVVDWSKAEEGVGGGGKIKEVPIMIDQLTFGSGPNEIVEHSLPGRFIERQPIVGNQFGFTISGLISHQFFRNHTLTFDFESMLLIVQ